ncbi:hypothetical protein [Spirosoma aerophilum]
MDFFVNYIAGAFTLVVIFSLFIKLFGFKAIEKGIGEYIETLFIRQKVRLEESVKDEFNKSFELFKMTIQVELAEKIEPLKAELGRSNIAFQVSHTEYIKRQYNHLEELFSKAYEISKAISEKINFSKLTFKKHLAQNEFLKNLLSEYLAKVYISSLYLNEDSRAILIEYAYNIENLFNTYSKYQTTLHDLDYIEESGGNIQYEDEDGEERWESYSSNQIDLMIKQNESLKETCEYVKEQCVHSFSSVDNTIKKFIYKPENPDSIELKYLSMSKSE